MPVGVPANSGSPWVTMTVLSARDRDPRVDRVSGSAGSRCGAALGERRVAGRRRRRAGGGRAPTTSAPPPLRNVLRENSLFEDLGHGYFPPFAITAAAFWIAVRIRGYVPQRQRWPFIAVRICASVGRLVVASRSAAWIIIPFWQ